MRLKLISSSSPTFPPVLPNVLYISSLPSQAGKLYIYLLSPLPPKLNVRSMKIGGRVHFLYYDRTVLTHSRLSLRTYLVHEQIECQSIPVEKSMGSTHLCCSRVNCRFIFKYLSSVHAENMVVFIAKDAKKNNADNGITGIMISGIICHYHC